MGLRTARNVTRRLAIASSGATDVKNGHLKTEFSVLLKQIQQNQ